MVIHELFLHMNKAPLQALEPHVSSILRVLEREDVDATMQRAVVELLNRMPTHWLACHLSLVMRAWTMAVEGTGWGGKRKSGEEEKGDEEDPDDCEWAYSYTTDHNYYDMEELEA